MRDGPSVLSKTALPWAALASVLFAAAASLLVVPWFGRPSLTNSDGSFAAAALLAAGLAGGACWLVVARYGPGGPILGGVAAGVGAGVLAHPLAWFLWTVLPPTSESVGAALLMTVATMWSLLFVGWITVPLGIAGGVATGALRVAVGRCR